MVVDTLNQIEDSKSKEDKKGTMVVTNLRLIWISETNQGVNLSIGLDCIKASEVTRIKS